MVFERGGRGLSGGGYGSRVESSRVADGSKGWRDGTREERMLSVWGRECRTRESVRREDWDWGKEASNALVGSGVALL